MGAEINLLGLAALKQYYNLQKNYFIVVCSKLKWMI